MITNRQIGIVQLYQELLQRSPNAFELSSADQSLLTLDGIRSAIMNGAEYKALVPAPVAPPNTAITPPGAPGPNPVWPTPPATTPTPGTSLTGISKPTRLLGVTLPLWGWGVAVFAAYSMFGRRRH